MVYKCVNKTDRWGFSGSIVTSPIGAIISDRYGRKVGMFSGAWVIILGAVIAATANKLAQLIVGRFVLGIGIQMMVVAAPAYAIEIAPLLAATRTETADSGALAIGAP